MCCFQESAALFLVSWPLNTSILLDLFWEKLELQSILPNFKGEFLFSYTSYLSSKVYQPTLLFSSLPSPNIPVEPIWVKQNWLLLLPEGQSLTTCQSNWSLFQWEQSSGIKWTQQAFIVAITITHHQYHFDHHYHHR